MLSLSYSQERNRSSEDTWILRILFKSTPLRTGSVIFHICLYLTSEAIFGLCYLFACFLNKYLLGTYQICARYFWRHNGNPERQDSWRSRHLLVRGLNSVGYKDEMVLFLSVTAFSYSHPFSTCQTDPQSFFFFFLSPLDLNLNIISNWKPTFLSPCCTSQAWGLGNLERIEDIVSSSHLFLFLPKEVLMQMLVFVF